MGPFNYTVKTNVCPKVFIFLTVFTIPCQRAVLFHYWTLQGFCYFETVPIFGTNKGEAFREANQFCSTSSCFLQILSIGLLIIAEHLKDQILMKKKSVKLGTLTRREQVAKLAARSLMEVIWAAATRSELAAMFDSPAMTRADLERIGAMSGVI
jgi:hypothetical protein